MISKAIKLNSKLTLASVAWSLFASAAQATVFQHVVELRCGPDGYSRDTDPVLDAFVTITTHDCKDPSGGGGYYCEFVDPQFTLSLNKSWVNRRGYQYGNDVAARNYSNLAGARVQSVSGHQGGGELALNFVAGNGRFSLQTYGFNFLPGTLDRWASWNGWGAEFTGDFGAYGVTACYTRSITYVQSAGY